MSKPTILEIAAETKRLAEAATPGPWEPCIGSGSCEMTALSHQEQEGPGTEFVCDLLPDWAILHSPRKNENMDFITAARTAVPLLADAVIRYEAERAEMVEVLRDVAKMNYSVFTGKVSGSGAIVTETRETVQSVKARALLTRLGVPQ